MIRKEVNFPNKSEGLAEFFGIMLGDGNLYISEKKGGRCCQIRIAGNYLKDYEYLTIFLNSLSKSLFNVEPRFSKLKGRNVLYLCMDYTNLGEILISIGFKPGNKIKNNIGIPYWIKKDKKFLAACIRGLFDTDGSMYELLPHWPGLFQINFKNMCKALLDDTREGLLTLGINVSKISMGTKIYVTKRSEIDKFYKLIGTNNDRLGIKFREFYEKSPMV